MWLIIKHIIERYKIWILTHIAAVIMLIILIIKPSYWKLFISYSAYTSLTFILLVVSLNPLKSFLPANQFIQYCNKYRREIGVAGFSYAMVHFLCFLIKRGSLKASIAYLIHPVIIAVFWIALPILFIMSITSNKFSIKKLGFEKWKKLHQKVYIAEATIFLHMVLVGQIKYALLLFIPVVISQLIRKKRAKKAARSS